MYYVGSVGENVYVWLERTVVPKLKVVLIEHTLLKSVVERRGFKTVEVSRLKVEGPEENGESKEMSTKLIV
jgi:hypothetical protein